jgi:NitT/TauT family transport system substrate-binding protein
MTQKPIVNRRECIILTASGAVLAVLSGLPALGATLGNVTFGVASIDPYSAPIYIADKLGYWTQEGLEVQYLNSQSGPRSKQMLAATQLFITSSGMNDSIALSLAGKPAVVVLGIDNRVTFANILCRNDRSDLKGVADLGGKTLAVTQPQAATWLMAVYIAEQYGVGDKVAMKGLGDFTTMVGAVKSGTVDACMATVSMINAARQDGWGKALFDVTETEAWNKVFGGDITGVCCYVLRESVENNRPQIQALVNGLVKGTDFVKTHSAEEITNVLYDKYLEGFPRQAVIDGINIYKKTWNYTNIVTKEVYERLIHVMGDGRQYKNEELAAYPYEKGVDMSFVKKARGI